MLDAGGPKPPTPPSPFQNSIPTAINNNGKIVAFANMAPTASTLYYKSSFGWGSAVAFDTNVGAMAPGLASGWNILSMPSVTAGSPVVPGGRRREAHRRSAR